MGASGADDIDDKGRNKVLVHSFREKKLTPSMSDLVFEKVELVMLPPQHSIAAPPYSASEPVKVVSAIEISTSVPA